MFKKLSSSISGIIAIGISAGIHMALSKIRDDYTIVVRDRRNHASEHELIIYKVIK